MIQSELFHTESISTRDILFRNAKEGVLFYGIGQVSTMVGKTSFEVRYAIICTYHIDAVRLDGEYRIPYSAIIDYLDYLENKTGEFVRYDGCSYDYDPARLAIDRYLLLLPHGKTPKGSRPYESIEGRTEDNPQDWYSLNDLPLPHEADSNDWACILGVSADIVEKNIGHGGLIGWPELYDWLIESEVINLPIPMDVNCCKCKEEPLPSLFD